jgi:hypothetical protein
MSLLKGAGVDVGESDFLTLNPQRSGIPIGTFDLFDYLLREYKLVEGKERMDKAYDVNDDTSISSAYEKLFRILDMQGISISQ